MTCTPFLSFFGRESGNSKVIYIIYALLPHPALQPEAEHTSPSMAGPLGWRSASAGCETLVYPLVISSKSFIFKWRIISALSFVSSNELSNIFSIPSLMSRLSTFWWFNVSLLFSKSNCLLMDGPSRKTLFDRPLTLFTLTLRFPLFDFKALGTSSETLNLSPILCSLL